MNHYLRWASAAVLLLIASLSSAQSPPRIQWSHCYGGTGGDIAKSIVPTDDGGFVIGGTTTSRDRDVLTHHTFFDCWVVKIDNRGAIKWSRSFGGNDADEAYGLAAAPDGGVLVAASTSSSDGDVREHFGGTDFWLVKVNASNILWSTTFGGLGNDLASGIAATSDSGAIIVGSSTSSDSLVRDHHGDATSRDFFVVKVDSQGTKLWQRSIGGTNDDVGNAVVATNDGGCVVVGSSRSNDGDVSNNHGSGDFCAVRLDRNGAIVWSRLLGGSGADAAFAVCAGSDGGFVVAGNTSSTDGDVDTAFGAPDGWVVKLDDNGAVVWKRTIGGRGSDAVNTVAQTWDGGYLVGGATDTDLTSDRVQQAQNAWLTKLRTDGSVEWTTTYGGSGIDIVFSVVATGNDDYICAGTTNSADGPASDNRGDYDFWMMSLGPASGVHDVASMSPGIPRIRVYPDPCSATVSVVAPNWGDESRRVIELTDMIGRTTKRIDLAGDRAAIDLSTVPAGLYGLRVCSREVTTHGTLVRVVR